MVEREGVGADPVAAARHLEGAGAEQLLRVASEAAGLRLDAARLRSVHHRGSRSVSHVYEATVTADGSPREVLLVAHVATDVPEGAFELERDGVRVAVWRFPHDPYLPGLPSALSNRRVRELLDGLGAPQGAVSLHTRAYRPSRRAVVEVRIAGAEANGRILYLKVLAGTRAQELARIHDDLTGHVPVPAVIGVAANQGILALEALPGRTLRQALIEDTPVPSPDALAGLLDRFAASGLASQRDPRAFADPRRHVPMLARLVPERAAEIARIAQDAGELAGTPMPVHGDLHDAQILLDDDGAIRGLLDVDGAGSGLLANDAGNLIAHVEVLAELHPEISRRVHDYASELSSVFRERLAARDLARGIAGAWIALATGPHRVQDHDWPRRTHLRLDRAAAALEGGP